MPERVVLEGNGVRLEPLLSSHVDALVLAASEDRSSYRFTSVPESEAAMLAYVTTALDDERSGWALPFVIRERARDRVVGTSRFLDLEYWTWPPAWPPGRPAAAPNGTPSAAEIGSTWLAASAQRTVVNTEAKLLMLTHAFEGWDVARVTFKTDARNQRSRDAIARLGAQFEGIRRAHSVATDGTVRDSAYFSVVASEWPAVKAALVNRVGT
jgi:RimJ/RimL family protein N-acetyltransferase